MQLDGVRLVNGVPERHPAVNNGVDVFWVGSPEKSHGGLCPPRARWRASKLEPGQLVSAPSWIGPEASLHVVIELICEPCESSDGLSAARKKEGVRMTEGKR